MWLVYVLLGLFIGLAVLPFYLKIERKKWVEEMEKENTIFRLAEGSTDVFYHYEVEPNFKFTYISPSLERYLGEGVIGEALEDAYAPFDRIHPEDHETLHKKVKGDLDYNQILIQRWRDNDGNYRWFEEYATPIYQSGEIVAVQGIMRNIDEKIKLQQNLEYRMSHDSLTGIYNREYFESACKGLNETENTSVAILICDLDDLKETNDTYGHKQGDILIQEAASLLQQFSSEDVTVARLGGDEFVLLATDKTKSEVKQLVSSILMRINEYNKNNQGIRIKMSIGFACSQNSIGEMEKLFAKADKNMYTNKNERKLLAM